MSTSPERILTITDLLLGAAHADHSRSPEEEAAVRKLLAELLGAKELPSDVAARLEKFDAKAFDPAKAAATLAKEPAAQRHNLLELVAAVRDADGEVDLDEDAYLRTVAKALDIPAEEFEDMVLDYEVEDLRENMKALTGE